MAATPNQLPMPWVFGWRKTCEADAMAHLLIIELPGGNDTDVVQAALDRGDQFTFLSAHLDHYKQQPYVPATLAFAQEQIEVAPFDYDEVEDRVLAVHAQCQIDAVRCLIDSHMPTAARLARRLGLRRLNPANASLLRDEFDVRRGLAERGLAQPSFELATSNEALQAAVERPGLPVLIKPADGSGSQSIVVLWPKRMRTEERRGRSPAGHTKSLR